MAQSIELNIADLANGCLKAHKLHHKIEQKCFDSEIDKVFKDYETMNEGKGSNRTDGKL